MVLSRRGFVTRISWAVVALCIAAPWAAEARAQFPANSIFFNLVEKPTNNKNVFGTTFDQDGFVSAWGNNYMLYELKMTVPDTIYEFQAMYLQVFANKGNNTSATNPLRFALFSQDPIAGDLTDSDALAKSFINQAAVSATFTQYLLGPAEGNIPVFPVDTEFNTNDYWLILYAGGTVANQGYGLKIDSVVKDIEFYDNTAESLTVQYLGGNPPTYQTAQPFVPLPEPSSLALAGIGACTAGAWIRRSRRV